eukprot:10315475-Prorocentrum_lima.AAC.1
MSEQEIDANYKLLQQLLPGMLKVRQAKDSRTQLKPRLAPALRRAPRSKCPRDGANVRAAGQGTQEDSQRAPKIRGSKRLIPRIRGRKGGSASVDKSESQSCRK